MKKAFYEVDVRPTLWEIAGMIFQTRSNLRKKGNMEEQKKKYGPDGCNWTERHIGHEVRSLDLTIGRLVNAYQSKVDEKAGINRMQGWIIGYLYRHSGQDVFQKDLEAEFQMEFQLEIMENFDRIQKILSADIPKEKLECFLEVLDMIKENAVRDCNLNQQ